MIDSSAICRIDGQTVKVTCVFCHALFEIPFSVAQQKDWEGGKLLQRVAPEVSADLLELLISGQCGECFDAAFANEEYDEEADAF